MSTLGWVAAQKPCSAMSFGGNRWVGANLIAWSPGDTSGAARVAKEAMLSGEGAAACGEMVLMSGCSKTVECAAVSCAGGEQANGLGLASTSAGAQVGGIEAAPILPAAIEASKAAGGNEACTGNCGGGIDPTI